MNNEIYVKEKPKSCVGCKYFAEHRRQCELELCFQWSEVKFKFNDCPLIDIKAHDRELAEKDIRIEELECQFAYECECNMQLVDLQKQLAEKQNTIDEINKEFVQAVHDWKTLCAEKDKEIEKLKQQYTILENENGKLTTELIMDKYKKAQKEVSFGKQLAIQELEKVKDYICDCTYIKEPDYTNVCRKIDNQIKELKGE